MPDRPTPCRRPPGARSRTGLVVAVAVVAALVLSACGGGDDAAPAPPAYDPPRGFAAPSGQLFGGPGSRVVGRDPDALPARLVGTSIWVTDGGRALRADSTGTTTPVTLPPGRYATGRPGLAPDGATVLLAAASVVPGAGTTPPGLAVDLLGADGASPAPPVAAPVIAPVTLPWSDRPAAVALRVVGVTAGVAVITASTDAHRTTLAVDLAARRLLWVVDGTRADAVLDVGPSAGVVVGVATPAGRSPSDADATVVGLDAVSGVRRFAGEPVRSPEVTRAGPGLVAVHARGASSPASLPGALSAPLGLPVPTAALRFLDARGATLRTVDTGSSSAAPRCVWDEAAVTVCDTGGRLVAVDATTAAPLWSLPDPAANRVAPALGTAWHGAVYGTTVNGPVVLDARTGADRDTAPGAAPVLVNAYLGVASEASGVAGLGGGAAITPAVR